MAIDYNVFSNIETPDFSNALLRGIAAGNVVRNIPLQQEALEREAAMQKMKQERTVYEDNRQRSQDLYTDNKRQQQDLAAQENQERQQTVEKVNAINNVARKLIEVPQEQRASVYEAQKQSLLGVGIEAPDISDFSDQAINSVIQQTSAFQQPSAPPDDFTLNEGQVRFDGYGNPIAGVPKKQDETKIQPMVDKLRSDYNSSSKDWEKITASYNKVNTASSNAAGDLSLIFGFMKMLDPGSVVREGEFATAQNAAGVPDRIMNRYNKVVSGERLSDDQRKSFKDEAKLAFNAQRSALDDKLSIIYAQADEDGIDRKKVLGAKELREFEKRAAEREIAARKEQRSTQPQQQKPAAAPTTQSNPRAINPQTGEILELINGQWQPIK